jgi:hypothetical protein
MIPNRYGYLLTGDSDLLTESLWFIYEQIAAPSRTEFVSRIVQRAHSFFNTGREKIGISIEQ